jgi:hypothetical protein
MSVVGGTGPHEQLDDRGCTLVYDVTGQPMPGWVVGAEPEPPEEEARGPPCDGFDWIDPPCPEDLSNGPIERNRGETAMVRPARRGDGAPATHGVPCVAWNTATARRAPRARTS